MKPLPLSLNRNQGFVSYNTLIGFAVAAVLLLVVIFSTFKYQTIEGNQAGVMETWDKCVLPDAYGPKTYWLNRWTENLHAYDMSGQVFVINSQTTIKAQQGRQIDVLEVKSSDAQRVHFDITLQWHRSIENLAKMHRQYRDDVEERLIRPTLLKVVSFRATIKPAIELYAGMSLVQLQKDIENELKDPNGALYQDGVRVDSFVIDRTEFPDAKYVENIEARQRALIAQSRFEAEQKSNQAEADAARIKALKDQYEQVVKADTEAKRTVINQQAESDKATIQTKADALNAVTKQEAESKKIVLQAEADAKKQVALSESARQAEINRATGIEAVGKAEAEANRLKLTSFSAPGSENYVKVEVSKQFAAGLNNIRFFPSNATYNTIASDFDKGLSLLVGGTGGSAATAAPAAK